MSTPSSKPPITAGEFYAALTVVWLFLLLLSLEQAADGGGWQSYILPVGALALLGLHALAWRRNS